MKVKDMYIKQLQDEFELELSYQEWLRDNSSEPSESELDEMEQSLIKRPYFCWTQIISEKALNNPYYNPSIGA
jgi:hypothetical protein